MNNIKRWADIAHSGVQPLFEPREDGRWISYLDHAARIDELTHAHHERLGHLLNISAMFEGDASRLNDQLVEVQKAVIAARKDRDVACDAVKREQQQFASLATEKREVVERLNGQLYESNKALSTSAQECQRVQAALSQAYQDIESLKETGRKMQEQLAEARRPPSYSQPPWPSTPALPNCAYRLSFGPELDAEFLKQGDCVVIVIRHANRAPVMPGSSISRVD